MRKAGPDELLANYTEDSLTMPVIYTSGPYRAASSWKIEGNIRAAEAIALSIWGLGAAVVCPHTLTRYYQGELLDDIWLSGDLALIRGVDAVYMLKNWEKSEGAIIEKAYAEKLGKPVLFNLDELDEYIKSFREYKNS